MNETVIIPLFDLVQDDHAVGNMEGRAVFQKLSQIVDEHPGQLIFGISLAGIVFTDASFPRESVISLAKLHRGEKGFYLRDFSNRDLMDNWDYAAKAKDQPILVWDGDAYTLLGPEFGTSTLQVLEFINQQGSTTSSKVASKFSLSSQNASGKLKKMFSQGLILGSRESAESGGVEFNYRAIK